MKLLLDTHFAIWMAIDPTLMTRTERETYDAADEIYLSAVAVWETRLKWDRYRIHSEWRKPVDPSVILAFAHRANWQMLDLTPTQAAAPLTVPLRHKDPFDHLLLVQAQEAGLLLLTRDIELKGHPFAFTP